MISQFHPEFHKGRRDALMLDDGDAVIVVGGKEHIRNNDIHFPFRQGSSMYYLTGFEEPDSVAIIQKERFTLIVRERNKVMEIWNGHRAGVKGAVEKYKADEAYTTDKLDSVIESVCKIAKRIFVVGESTNQELTKKIQGLTDSYEDLNSKVNTLRMHKQNEELYRLTRANEISSLGHITAMKACQTTKGTINECQIRAEIEKVFFENGSPRLGYPSIVAAGANATILHYPEANAFVKPGDLILIDAGAEYGNYTADITRTWPISGKFTEEQRAIYQIVYDAQEACFEALKPGITISQLHKISEQVISEGLKKLGIMKEETAVKQFYPHTIGHYLGLDVHDVAPKSWSKGAKDIPLEANMVITVEPGIYIQEDDETVDPKWRGIGIRIEDNLVLTEYGSFNLTTAPRSIEEIEAVFL